MVCSGLPGLRHVLPGSPPPAPLEAAGDGLPGAVGAPEGSGSGGFAGLPGLPGGGEALGSAALAVWGLLALLVLASIAVYALLAFRPRTAAGGLGVAAPAGGGSSGGGSGDAPYPIPRELLALRARLRRAAAELGLPRGATGLEAARASGDPGLMEAAKLYYEALFAGRRRGGR